MNKKEFVNYLLIGFFIYVTSGVVHESVHVWQYSQIPGIQITDICYLSQVVTFDGETLEAAGFVKALVPYYIDHGEDFVVVVETQAYIIQICYILIVFILFLHFYVGGGEHEKDNNIKSDVYY